MSQPPQARPATHRHTLITSMRDEGPFILEWVAHHLVLGFDRIVIGSNDCRDGSDALLSALARQGVIEHLENRVPPGEIPQHAAYMAMRQELDIDDTDWLMVLDADEFLNVQVGNHRVADLTDRAEQAGGRADIISLHAMCFTAEPEINWQPGRICPRFPWRLALAHSANRAMKSLTRAPGRFRQIHNHSVVGFKGNPGELRILGGDGQLRRLKPDQPMWQQLRNTPVRPEEFGLAWYNHYAVKTWDSFNLRRERGRGAVAMGEAENTRHTAEYFAQRNQPDQEERSILRHDAEVAARMAAILALPGIAGAQAECESRYAALAAPWRRKGPLGQG